MAFMAAFRHRIFLCSVHKVWAWFPFLFVNIGDIEGAELRGEEQGAEGYGVIFLVVVAERVRLHHQLQFPNLFT